MLFKKGNYKLEAAQELHVELELEELDDVQLTAVRGGGIGYAKVKAGYSDQAYAKYFASAGGGIGNPPPSAESIKAAEAFLNNAFFNSYSTPINLGALYNSDNLATFDVAVEN